MNDEGPWYYWLVVNLSKRFKRGVVHWISNHKILTIVITVFFLIIGFLNRPFVQPLFLGIRKYFVLIALLVLIVTIVFRKVRSAGVFGRIVLSSFLSLVMVLSVLYGSALYKHLGLYHHFNQISTSEIDRLPQTGFERIQSFESIGDTCKTRRA